MQNRPQQLIMLLRAKALTVRGASGTAIAESRLCPSGVRRGAKMM